MGEFYNFIVRVKRGSQVHKIAVDEIRRAQDCDSMLCIRGGRVVDVISAYEKFSVYFYGETESNG